MILAQIRVVSSMEGLCLPAKYFIKTARQRSQTGIISLPTISIASSPVAGIQPSPNIISDELRSDNVGAVDIFGSTLNEDNNQCGDKGINHLFNNIDKAGNGTIGKLATSTFSEPVTEAQIGLDTLLRTEVNSSQQTTPILSPLILSLSIQKNISETHPSPADSLDQSFQHQGSKDSHIIPRKLSLATVQELEKLDTPSPPTSPETTISIALPASSLSFTTAISNLPRPFSLLPSMSESSESADVSNRSELYDSERNFDCSVASILRQQQDDRTTSEADSRCFGCDTEKIKQCWVQAMRLAKYGRQLKENYKSFKNKGENIGSKDFVTTVPDVIYPSRALMEEEILHRVAMDFTGGAGGRIVDNPDEIERIAEAEGYAWQQRWKRTALLAATPCPPYHHLLSGMHRSQPWFHAGISRDKATYLVQKYGTVDGVFLVRDSRSQKNNFVITYIHNHKVLHAQVQTVKDDQCDRHVLTIDNGRTRFYDLLQLVEFYQLNTGVLATRLTHYVVLLLTQDDDRRLREVREVNKKDKKKKSKI